MDDLNSLESASDLDISIVIPTYNEVDNIRILLPRLHELFKSVRYEIVIVDDNSPDGTADCAETLAGEGLSINVIRKKNKEGIGAAIRMGYQAGKGKYLSSMDADLSFKPEDLKRLYEEIRNGADLVLGCRHCSGGFYETPNPSIRRKYLVSRAGNKILRMLTRIPLSDFSANFRVIRSDVWRKINTEENTNTLLFEMVLKTWIDGFEVIEVPISFMDRQYGESKLELPKESVKFLVKLLRYLFIYRKELYGRGNRTEETA